jgi:hypothetical protein
MRAALSRLTNEQELSGKYFYRSKLLAPQPEIPAVIRAVKTRLDIA